MIVVELALALVLLFIVIRRPFLGIVFTAASLPVVEVLPDVPMISSVVPLLGAVTLAAFLLGRRKEHTVAIIRLGYSHLFGLLLIGWIYLSNPMAAWFGTDRNWIFTFIQLFVLLWLAGELLDTPEKQRTLMWGYSISAIVSALIAIRQENIGMGTGTLTRVMGLAEGVNTAARYFVVALVMLLHLRTTSANRFSQILATGGVFITFLGIIFTVSRTGILLLFPAVGLLVILQPGVRYKVQLIFLTLAVALLVVLLFSNIVDLVRSIAPSILQGTDTAGLRYALWKAGWRMWQAHPIAGVGIGMFPVQLFNYAQDLPIPSIYMHLVAHNTYIEALAETGFVGLGLYIVLLGRSMLNLWPGRKVSDPNVALSRNIWFIIFVVMLLGGITKSDFADKMIWLTMGVSLFFQRQLEREKLDHPASDEIMPARSGKGYIRRSSQDG
jgi:O-antigen ligase